MVIKLYKIIPSYYSILILLYVASIAFNIRKLNFQTAINKFSQLSR